MRGIIMIMVEMRIIVFRGKTSKILAVKRTGGSSHGAQRTGQEEEDEEEDSFICMRYLYRERMVIRRRGEQAPSGDPVELTFTSETRDYRRFMDSSSSGGGEAMGGGRGTIAMMTGF